MANKLTDALVMKRENAQPCSVEFAFTLPQDAVKAETDRVVSYVASAVADTGPPGSEIPEKQKAVGSSPAALRIHLT